MKTTGVSARLASAALLAALAMGCGQPSPDLFEVRRSGPGPGSDVTLVVSDGGTVRCNRGEPRTISSEQLLTARELERQLSEAAALGLELPAGDDAPTLTYRVRLEAGRASFTDTAENRPASFDRLAGFVTDVAENVCGIER